jgi:hypothetical protein
VALAQQHVGGQVRLELDEARDFERLGLTAAERKAFVPAINSPSLKGLLI